MLVLDQVGESLGQLPSFQEVVGEWVLGVDPGLWGPDGDGGGHLGCSPNALPPIRARRVWSSGVMKRYRSGSAPCRPSL